MKSSFNLSNNHYPARNKISQAAYATYFVIIFAFLTIRFLNACGVLSFMSPLVSSIISSIFIQVILMFTCSLFMFSGMVGAKPKDTLKFFGYKKITKKALLIAVIIGLIIFFLNSYIANFFANILQALGFRSQSSTIDVYPWWMLILNLIFTAILPAICEETAHRGLLLKSSFGLGPIKATILSGLLFGLIHMNIQQFFYATLIGFYLGYLAMSTDSIYPCMIVHFLNNALICVFNFCNVNNMRFASFMNKFLSIGSYSKAVSVVFNVFFFGFLAFALVWTTKKITEECTHARVAHIERYILQNALKMEFYSSLENYKNALQNKDTPEQDKRVLTFENIFYETNYKLGYLSDIEKKVVDENKDYKIDGMSLLLLISAFIIGITVSLSTFIWGLL